EGGLDEDEDGAPDCDDSDCAQDPVCVVDDDVPNVECADICAHERECATSAAADCDRGCTCTVDAVFAAAFVDAYYGCRLATSCGALGDDACIDEVDDFP